MAEAHKSKFSVHPGSTKMYRYLKNNFWWNGRKRDVADCLQMSGLPKSRQSHDGIWVIVDKLTKTSHFLPVRMNYNLDKLASLYMDNIVRLHGVPVSILSDRDPSYHSSIGMVPYKALYGRKFRSPFYWDEVGEKAVVGPELVQMTVDKVKIVREKFKAAQDRQKSWADLKRRPV
ncbi:uncharacterized protein LOC142550021 [Primulina tabacum]|uniref:uncharacterized protein LOC142550021 n=1 Tax=Primulina tabacum TaxID=48773 RepID=UPI003F5A3194